MSQSVIQYVLYRLKQLGVSDIFGVPGDFVYPVCDAIIDDSDIKWFGCANELNASYAADGYARTKGVGVVLSTYGAGETCTWSGLAGANAENSKVISLVGMPGISEWESETRSHHMISDQPPEYELFTKMLAPFTAGGNCSVVITPENCVYETERLIAALLYYSRPINMAFPRDIVNQPVVLHENKPSIPLSAPKSNNDALEAVVRELVHQLSIAKQACILPSYLLRRYSCVNEARALIEKSGLPFFVTLQDKSILPESHPQFGGVYLGQWNELADSNVSNYVNGCDCIIGLGPEKHDLNTGFYSMKHDFKSTINIMAHKTRIGMATYEKVEMKDVLTEFLKKISECKISSNVTYAGFFDKPSGHKSDKITYTPLFERVQEFLKTNDILVADASISAICGSAKMKLPDGVDLEAQTSWGAIGWGTPSILGHCVAAPDRRCIILAGEGGHQMTANNMGTFYRYGLKPVFLLINNGGFLAERVTNRNPDEEYNDIPDWNFADIPKAMGCKDWYTVKVTTLGELDSALSETEKADCGVYIEIVIDKYDIPSGADYVFNVTGRAFGMPNRSWSEWKEKFINRTEGEIDENQD